MARENEEKHAMPKIIRPLAEAYLIDLVHAPSIRGGTWRTANSMDEERRRAQANMASTADIQGNPILPGGHPRGQRTTGNGRGEAGGAKNQDPETGRGEKSSKNFTQDGPFNPFREKGQRVALTRSQPIL